MLSPSIIKWIIVFNCTCQHNDMVCLRPKGFKEPLFCVNNIMANNFNEYLTGSFKEFPNISTTASTTTNNNNNISANNNTNNNYILYENLFKLLIIFNQVKFYNYV